MNGSTRIAHGLRIVASSGSGSPPSPYALYALAARSATPKFCIIVSGTIDIDFTELGSYFN